MYVVAALVIIVCSQFRYCMLLSHHILSVYVYTITLSAGYETEYRSIFHSELIAKHLRASYRILVNKDGVSANGSTDTPIMRQQNKTDA